MSIMRQIPMMIPLPIPVLLLAVVASLTQCLAKEEAVADAESHKQGRFPVRVSGGLLVHNDGSGRRFFAAGMVDNRPASGNQLSRYKHDEMREQLQTHARIGATVMRWNTFLKGQDLRWDQRGRVTGIVEGGVEAICDGLDLAEKNGVLIQITLSTGHFLQYGWKGAADAQNKLRVANNKLMFQDEAALDAYLEHVVRPIAKEVGPHPALLGYLIVNEAHAMLDKKDSPNGGWADENVSLAQMQRFVNRVAGTLKSEQPGVLVSVSSIAKLMSFWEDDVLIAAGGDPAGKIDWHQIQFYPDTHIAEWSPFENTAEQLREAFSVSEKPVVCGEFPMGGLVVGANKRRSCEHFGLSKAYQRLWDNGHSGGFTWSYNVYNGKSAGEKASIENAYIAQSKLWLEGRLDDRSASD
jgi:endo-1,4-beta-mannosidase